MRCLGRKHPEMKVTETTTVGMTSGHPNRTSQPKMVISQATLLFFFGLVASLIW